MSPSEFLKLNQHYDAKEAELMTEDLTELEAAKIMAGILAEEAAIEARIYRSNVAIWILSAALAICVTLLVAKW